VTTLSVLTPSYNYARFIPDALESVAAQAIDVEHVVQDGASTDGTVEVLRSRSGISWESAPDDGQSDALNRALRRAGGEWVSWLNADEFYLPNALARLIEVGNASGADVVYGDAVFVDEAGRLERLVPQHRFSGFVLHRYGTFISTCACVIRRSVFPPDPFDARLRLLMDRDVFMYLRATGARFDYVELPVGAFRVHGDRVSAGDESGFARDRGVIADRYGSVGGLGKHAGRLAHAGLKAARRGYGLQRRAESLRGRDLRWFVTTEGAGTAKELASLYGTSDA
jgi:glycosyltransferase involved in cell wall biosynthesis